MARENRLTGWLLAAAAVVVPLLMVGFVKWRAAVDKGGNEDADPFRIAGNLYFVGGSDISVFLITTPQGHVLIDGAHPGSPPQIVKSIAKLGFDIKDVKVILSSEAHNDHAGGLAELQRLSGAQIWASDSSAEGIESGGDVPEASYLPMTIFREAGVMRYDPARVNRRVKDGDTLRFGPLLFTAHITSGHTIGCTTWTFTVRDSARTLDVVDACSLALANGMRFVGKENYPGIRADFERSFQTLRSLPADVWVTSHGRPWGRYRKYVASQRAPRPVDVFIDPAGYRAYVDSAEARLRREIARQEQRK